MGFEYQMRMTCDRCRKEIEPWTAAKSLDKLKLDVRYAWILKHDKDGTMLGLPNRYGKYSIFCQPCADGVPNDRTQARRPLSNDKQKGDPGVA